MKIFVGFLLICASWNCYSDQLKVIRSDQSNASFVKIYGTGDDGPAFELFQIAKQSKFKGVADNVTETLNFQNGPVIIQGGEKSSPHSYAIQILVDPKSGDKIDFDSQKGLFTIYKAQASHLRAFLESAGLPITNGLRKTNHVMCSAVTRFTTFCHIRIR